MTELPKLARLREPRDLPAPLEVRVRVWITEPDGREVEVEQAVPVPNHDGAHVLEALHSTYQLARWRYERPVTRPSLRIEHRHTWQHRSSMGDAYRVCTTCGEQEEVDHE